MSCSAREKLDIEIVHSFERGRFRFAVFDFDGTISLLREGWQKIMHPVCVEMICGNHPPTPEIEAEVAQMIDETTGIQTIFQMERLVEMVRAHGLVPESQIRDAAGYKQVYLERLMVPVRERIARLHRGELSLDDVTVRGVRHFLDALREREVAMYLFSGTDREDVQYEAQVLEVDHYFQEIWGALPSVEEYSKEKVIRELLAAHRLKGTELLVVGDGPVELRNAKEYGGTALGIASDEKRGQGWDLHKRERLLRAGADLLVPDFTQAPALVRYLFAED